MFSNRQKYQLDSALGKLKLNRDPMGWDDTETEIGRSEKTYGIFLTISNNLQFTGEAKDYLETVYRVYGVNANVKLTKWVKHPQTDEWNLAKGFPGFLDFTTRKIESNKLKIDFIEGGLRELLTAQIKEKFELNRTESIKGLPITPFNPDELTLEGRNIYLLSKLQGKQDFWVRSGEWDSSDFRTVFQPFPMDIIANSDPENIATPTASANPERTDPVGAQTMFYLIADRNRGATKITCKASFKINEVFHPNAESNTLKVVFRKYTGGSDYILSEPETVIMDIGNPEFLIGQSFTTPTFELELEPQQGESYAFGLNLTGIYGAGTAGSGRMEVQITEQSSDISVSEDSFYQKTTAPFLTAYEVGQRLTEIFSGRKKFISSLLSEGTWKDLGFTCGGWLRNLKIKKEDETEKDWPLTISFEDFYKSIHAPFPVGYGIVTKGAKQFITLENIRYFFQPYVTIRLGQVSNVKRETAAEYVFSSITTGYTKGGNYEKPLGLDEYNIQSTNTTPVTVTENKYEVLGTSRADSYGVEQARRMQYKDFPDEDTEFDRDNFLIDAKFKTRSNVKNYYGVRLWQEDFEQAPTGVYSPKTAFNLRLSPPNNKYRHAIWFNSATVKYPKDKIRFASSEGNSELKTKFPGKPEVKGNGDTLISELSNPIFEPEWINFEYESSQDLLDTIQGTTEINGKEINNYYGLVEFINENKQKEKGYLFSAKVKDKFTFKILKSYGF